MRVMGINRPSSCVIVGPLVVEDIIVNWNRVAVDIKDCGGGYYGLHGDHFLSFRDLDPTDDDTARILSVIESCKGCEAKVDGSLIWITDEPIEEEKEER